MEDAGPRLAFPLKRRDRTDRPEPSADPEAMAVALEATGRYRVLRQLQPRPIAAWPEAGAPGAGIAVILDTETTGLDARRDEVIELGMVAVTYDAHGIGVVVDVYSELREPGVPISAEITRITGISQDMVAGRSIDPQAVAAFVARADLVVAHNATFDRPFCERLAPGFDTLRWACSVAEVDWTARGYEGAKLGYLVGQSGWFHQGHRAVDDCHALLEVLARPRRPSETPPFLDLLAAASRRRCRIWAEGSPFHTKDLLKARGYRWNDGTDGRAKSWWVEVEEAAFETELAFLRTEIFRAAIDPPIRWMDATERFRIG
ncbi:DNA polymerase III subunit epsilon [Aureimonas sp. Leaf454]|uniref:3'-5' exonuclease n=1 Tax=Aureimonas sp. Leaf454 TaxID=1736381 RepID=UPI0006FD0CD0|nr:3'-5' exonuclease [Aureimonas sp. Leaf454]KQT54961.1 DNA polymerase III subunit epsilon [Aureimonas sp. Leaf454]